MNNSMTRRRKLQIAITAAILVLVVAGTFLFFKTRRPAAAAVAIDQTFGLQPILGVAESGFHNSEMGKSPAIPYRWTNGAARLSIPFQSPAPVAIHTRIGLTVPRPTKMEIRANGHSLFNETVSPRMEWARTFQLAGLNLSSPLELEILSDSFVPSKEKEEVSDARQLGVRIHGITLLRELPDVTGLNLVAETVPGIDMTGFHNLEKCDGQPCRWTDGTAKLIVPVRSDSRWKKLTLAAEIPDRPNWRISVSLNGTRLFDEAVKSGEVWTKELPIDNLDPSREATIELTSSSIEPGTTKTKDGRRLGIRVRKVILSGD